MADFPNLEIGLGGYAVDPLPERYGPHLLGADEQS
jgi:hypothetical protein